MLATVAPEDDQPVGPQEKLYCGLSINYETPCAEAARAMDAANRIVRDWPKGMKFGLLVHCGP